MDRPTALPPVRAAFEWCRSQMAPADAEAFAAKWEPLLPTASGPEIQRVEAFASADWAARVAAPLVLERIRPWLGEPLRQLPEVVDEATAAQAAQAVDREAGFVRDLVWHPREPEIIEQAATVCRLACKKDYRGAVLAAATLATAATLPPTGTWFDAYRFASDKLMARLLAMIDRRGES